MTTLITKTVLFLFSASFFYSAASSFAYGDSSDHRTLYSPEIREKRKYNTNQLIKSYLERSAFTHSVLSENMANVNTPGYKANDVPVARDYDSLMGSKSKHSKIRMMRTNRNHIAGNRNSSDSIASEKLKDPYEIKPNGNNVSIAQQMTKLSQNQQDYNVAVKSYVTTNALISTALGK